MSYTSSVLNTLTDWLSNNPAALIAQAGLVIVASLLVFFILFTLRDVILRTDSFLLQIFSIILVAAIPFFGFLIYLLVRPARTVKQRRMELLLQEILERVTVTKTSQQPPKQNTQKKRPPPLQHENAPAHSHAATPPPAAAQTTQTQEHH